MRKIENFTSINNLSLDSIKEAALKRATAKTYFAIVLLLLSLFAAFAITGKANKSVAIWSASSDLVAGDLITKSNIKKVKVFLPENSTRYLSANSRILDQIATRRIVSGELIPSSAISTNFAGESIRSVPLKIARNDLPNDLSVGQSVDIYSLPQPDLNSQKNQKTELISQAVIVESIDIKSRDIGGDIGIVLKIPEPDVISLLSSINSSRIVVVRNAI
ncbi:MAG: hypothetical protein D4R69_01100 [Actinomycetales bacterium]|nr:MAG: hypothetical protein D4R69_01100 [Actinomycetales bacterium]